MCSPVIVVVIVVVENHFLKKDEYLKLKTFSKLNLFTTKLFQKKRYTKNAQEPEEAGGDDEPMHEGEVEDAGDVADDKVGDTDCDDATTSSDENQDDENPSSEEDEMSDDSDEEPSYEKDEDGKPLCWKYSGHAITFDGVDLKKYPCGKEIPNSLMGLTPNKVLTGTEKITDEAETEESKDKLKQFWSKYRVPKGQDPGTLVAAAESFSVPDLPDASFSSSESEGGDKDNSNTHDGEDDGEDDHDSVLSANTITLSEAHRMLSHDEDDDESEDSESEDPYFDETADQKEIDNAFGAAAVAAHKDATKRTYKSTLETPSCSQPDTWTSTQTYQV